MYSAFEFQNMFSMPKSFIFQINLKAINAQLQCSKLLIKLDVDPQRDDDASPMSSYRCMLRPT